MRLFPAVMLSGSIVCVSLLVLINQLVFDLPWNVAVPSALIATVMGQWIGLFWLSRRLSRKC